MNRLSRLLLITFVESFATVLVERGVYFYAKTRLGFGPGRTRAVSAIGREQTTNRFQLAMTLRSPWPSVASVCPWFGWSGGSSGIGRTGKS